MAGGRCRSNLGNVGVSAAGVAPAFEQVFVDKGDRAIFRAMTEEMALSPLSRRPPRSSASSTSSASGSSTKPNPLELTAEARKAFYIVSLSASTLIYKGMLTASQIEGMFPDLSDPLMESALALVHQRFSTNTFPSWPLAHPYRYVAHNGEINTLRGNINWMRAREGLLQSSVFGDDLRKVLPVIRPGGSDTASFDNVLEFLVMAGRSLPHAVLMMIPEPWSGNPTMDPAVRAFYEYHSSLMEPWDGPASIAFTDGTLIGAVLDRNGLRPSRYCITKDGRVIMASEVGVLDIPAERVVVKDRLRPGKMLLIDTGQDRIISDDEIKQTLAAEHPVRRVAAAASGRRRRSAARLRRAARSPDRAAPAAGLRLHAGRPARPPHADGAGRRRADRLDGDRHRARRAVRAAAPALRLLLAALRAGHQPAARRDPRGAGDVDGLDDWPGGQPARRGAASLPPDQDRVSDPPQRSGREAAPPAAGLAVPFDDVAAALQPG